MEQFELILQKQRSLFFEHKRECGCFFLSFLAFLKSCIFFLSFSVRVFLKIVFAVVKSTIVFAVVLFNPALWPVVGEEVMKQGTRGGRRLSPGNTSYWRHVGDEDFRKRYRLAKRIVLIQGSLAPRTSAGIPVIVKLMS